MSLNIILLAMLVKESYLKLYGQCVVFRQILSELKDLCTEGFVDNKEQSFVVNVLGILGDNLGLHYIGGFSENFNTEHFCRFCLFGKSLFQKESYVVGEAQTRDSYDDCIQILQQDCRIKSHLDVKFNSVFNQLPGFHICDLTLPPCIGHDIFEGIMANDMALFVQYFTKNHWFTYDTLNNRILAFNYEDHDGNDRPPVIPVNASKLSGQAVENWCLVRMFSLLVFGLIRNTKDKVWKLYLSLKEIVELVCSQKISHRQILYLDVICKDYVDRRKKHFPSFSLKPKHHFLIHYAELTIKFGPLMRLWTLRMQSKHLYFKRCARAVKSY